MATRNIVPNANNEGSLGTDAKRWAAGHFQDLKKAGESVVTEAPSDGKKYARKDGAWVESGGSNQIVSSGGIANLTSNQQAAINEGTIVTTTNGKRWVYSGTGSKTSEASYVELADIAPEWSAIANKPNLLAADDVAANGITLDNGAKLQKGTTDSGLGGAKGIALKCSLDYEFKWEAGRLYTMQQDGFTIRSVEHCFTATPTANDDETKGFVVGSRWILDDGTIYECTDASEGDAEWQEVIVSGGGGSTNYILKNADFTAEAGKNYAVDAHPVPAVMPTVTLGGLKFTGTSASQTTSINIFDNGNLSILGDTSQNLEIGYEPGVTTLAGIVSIMQSEGNGITLVELAPGFSGTELRDDGDPSGVLSGGQVEGYASVEATLPANPTTGDVVGFADARATWNNYPLTVLRNGKKIEGGTANFENNAAGTFFGMVYIDNTTGWRVLSSGTKPLNLSVPSISGTYAFNSTNGTWTGSPTSFSYQWQISTNGTSGWTNIGGATASTYQAVAGDGGKYVRVGVIATNANGPSLTVYSAASSAITVPTFASNGLLAFWKLDNVNDASGNGYTLTNNNTVTFASGKIGNAAQFNGSNSLTGASVSIAGDFTESLWFKGSNIDGGGGFGVMFAFGAVSAGMQFYYKQDGQIIAYEEGSSGGFKGSTNPGVISNNTWHHLVLRRSSGSTSIYVDNVLRASGSTSTAFSGDVFVGVHLNGSADKANGLIDALGLWNRALTVEEIDQLYSNGNGVELA